MAKKYNKGLKIIGERIRFIRGSLSLPEFGKKIGANRNTVGLHIPIDSEHRFRSIANSVSIHPGQSFRLIANSIPKHPGQKDIIR